MDNFRIKPPQITRTVGPPFTAFWEKQSLWDFGTSQRESPVQDLVSALLSFIVWIQIRGRIADDEAKVQLQPVEQTPAKHHLNFSLQNLGFKMLDAKCSTLEVSVKMKTSKQFLEKFEGAKAEAEGSSKNSFCFI